MSLSDKVDFKTKYYQVCRRILHNNKRLGNTTTIYVCLLITELKVQKAEIERDNSIITVDLISVFLYLIEIEKKN